MERPPTLLPDPHALEREVSQLRRAVDELSILNDLAWAVGAAHHPDAVIHTLVKQSIRAIGAEQGVVSLFDASPDSAAHTLIRRAADAGAHDPLRLNPVLLGWILKHRAPLLANNLAADPRFATLPLPDGIHSLLCVPLLVRGHMIGVLALFNKQGGTPFTADDQRLLSIIAGQSAQAIENARLLEEERTLVRMQEEVEVARQIQTRLLPTRPPVVAGYAFAGRTRPAEEVGGDYFDFIPLPQHRMGVCVGDVSGKGLPAALLMAGVQATLRALAPTVSPPDACLTRANELLHASTAPDRFVTLFYGVLDAERHLFTYANAGHNRPYLLRPGAEPRVLREGGLMLGGIARVAYTAATLALEPGDTVVIFSDGIVEAMNAQREDFGEARLYSLLAEYGTNTPADALAARIEAAALAHTAGAPQADDLTVLVLQRT